MRDALITAAVSFLSATAACVVYDLLSTWRDRH